MERRGLSTEDLKRLTHDHVHDRTVRRWVPKVVNDDTKVAVISGDHAVAVADLLGVSLDWLLAGRDTARASLDAWVVLNRVPPDCADWLRGLPIEGLRPSHELFRGLQLAWVARAERSPTAAVASALQSSLERQSVAT